MLNVDRNTYARKALAQMPRLLSFLDRNPHSPSYGSFDRAYWHDKTSDFSDIDNQFGVHALALVYTYDFPDNPYKGEKMICDWAIAAMAFWASAQHADGSFDEHYPFEHGWVGPTGFSTYACIEAYQLLKDKIPAASAERIRNAIRTAARYLARGQTEDDHLANHHAMGCLAVWKAYELLKEEDLKQGYDRLWKGFLSYHHAEEGWSREYDGPDPGYLSATVSFLAKIYQTNPDPAIRIVLDQSIKFCSYFVYPDGFYAGHVGSRNTLHFYPHGFEVMASKNPLAASVAEKMLSSLEQGKLVPPEIMPDRYMAYRLPEYFLAYKDYAPRTELAPLPYEGTRATTYFPQARVHVMNHESSYTVASLGKGGVVKSFDKKTGKLLVSDAGILAKLESGELLSSQWWDETYELQQDKNGWEISGQLHAVPASKRFTPLTFILFRITLLMFGWSPGFCHWLKRRIRRALILQSGHGPIRFTRKFSGDSMAMSESFKVETDTKIISVSLGGDFMTRHVPQSEYFQPQDLVAQAYHLSTKELLQLNTEKQLTIQRRFNN